MSPGTPGAPGVPGGRRGPDWTALLGRACSGVGISSVYQPIVDVVRGVTVGYEALARFDHRVEGGPAMWFSAARARGRAGELEAAALRSALRERPGLPRNCFLTVNVSPDLLAHDEVRSVWGEQGDLGGVVVELTEQVPITSYAALDGDLAALRAAGALIAVDDAGAGYAGLRHLLVLRPSLIKLDRDLVSDIDLDEAKRALVEMVGTFAGRIDAWLLAEGVERAEELDVLAALGVPLAQGFLLGRPEAPWPTVDDDVALRLAARSDAPATDTVRDLVEIVPTVLSIADAARHFAVDRTHTVVVIDEHVRPLAVCTPDLLHLGVVERGLRVTVDTPVVDALDRALTRQVDRRYEPVLCTDGAGRFLGVVRLERMIRTALA